MSDLPLFDSLTHPTLDGTWIGPSARDGTWIPSTMQNNTLHTLESQMAANNVRWALAVGMKGIGGYQLEAYADYIRTASQRILPIAYFDFEDSDRAADISRKLDETVRCGYVGIKLHPRFSRIDVRSEGLREVFRAADARKLVVLVCTYLYGCAGGEVPRSYLDFARLLAAIPETCKVILLHGGDVNVLSMMEVSRAHPNVLLDLSFTLCRYEGSSVDLDIRYLFRSYDRRICVGSDNPQFGLDQLRRRFEQMAAGVEREKCANIAHRNLQSFFGGV